MCVLLRVRVWCGAVFTSRTRRDWILCTTFKSLNGTKITTALRPVTSTSLADTMYSSRSSSRLEVVAVGLEVAERLRDFKKRELE